MLDFSSSGRYLCTVGLDPDHTLVVWKWQEALKVSKIPTGPNRVFTAQFRPDSDSHFVSVGQKHLTFWTVAGSALLPKRPHIPQNMNHKKQTMLSVAFGIVSFSTWHSKETAMFTHAQRSVLIRSELFFLTQVANIGATFGDTIIFTKLVERSMENSRVPSILLVSFYRITRHSKLAVGGFLTHVLDFFFHFLKNYPVKSEIIKDFKYMKFLLESHLHKLLCLVFVENNYGSRKCPNFEPLIVSSKIFFFSKSTVPKKKYDQSKMFNRTKQC